MTNIYSTSTVCKPNDINECLDLDDLSEILLDSMDYCKNQWAWEGWRNATGPKIRGYYTAYAMLQNAAALQNAKAPQNDFKSAKDMWTSVYTNDWLDGEYGFYNEIEDAWVKVKPLYQKLHAFAKMKLEQHYKDFKFPSTGQIPAHLLGNMWAQDWTGLYDLLKPYPKADSMNIALWLKEAKYSVKDLFELSDKFFQTLDMDKMTETFWEKSVFEKPDGIDMVCHASAWDFYKTDDFRIKMCTKLNEKNFQTVHHEMGHIQYFMEYAGQTVEFREGANPGWHEAIGDLIALSVMTPGHLKTVGLLKDFEDTEGKFITRLYIYLFNVYFFL